MDDSTEEKPPKQQWQKFKRQKHFEVKKVLVTITVLWGLTLSLIHPQACAPHQNTASKS